VWADDGWVDDLRKAKSLEEYGKVVSDAPGSLKSDPIIAALMECEATDATWRDDREHLASAVEARTRIQAVAPPEDARETAREILADPRYRDPGAAQGSSWLGRAMRSFWNWLRDLLDRLFGSLEASTPAGGISMQALEPVVWALLIGALAIATIVVLRKANWAALRRRRAVGGLLDDDEPDRTADEWLLEADQLESEGRHREAVRCLYLACLVRLDDARVAAFVRSDTNWEHVRRIEASRTRPTGLDFRSVTRHFDRVWYGYQDQNSEAVVAMRAFYVELMTQLASERS
jgi:hypothetical protein